MGHVHRFLRWIIFTLGGIVGLLAILVLAGPSIRSRQMERAIARFEKQPTQSRADNLVELLEAHAGTDEQGRRALTLLLCPKITTRKAYAAGGPIAIGAELPFKVDFRSFLWNEETISVNGQPVIQHHSDRTLDHGPSTLDVPMFDTQPGTYPVELRIQCSLGIERASRGMTLLGYLHDALPRLIPDPRAWLPARTYECDFTVPSEVSIVADAEKVELTSSPALDQVMRGAFYAKYEAMETTLPSPAGPRRVRGSARIVYENIPQAAAFSILLRLPDGREIPQQGVWPEFLARAGSSGDMIVNPSSFPVETPGRRKATLVLIPDPNLAYRDPAIKAIWNGVLEFPISFFVDANQPSR